MNRVLILAGSEGALGKGVHSVLSKKDFTQIIVLSDIYNKSTSAQGKRPDFSEPSVVEGLFSDIFSNKKTIFYLFSSIGGFTGGKPIWEADGEDAILMMKKNFATSYNLLKEFSNLVARSAGGAAVFVSAWSATHPDANRTAYASSKAALNHLIQAASVEGKVINLSVTGIAPFVIDTPSNREWMPEAKWPLMQKPEEIGEFVYQLFNFAHAISGNIIEMGERIPLLNFDK